MVTRTKISNVNFSKENLIKFKEEERERQTQNIVKRNLNIPSEGPKLEEEIIDDYIRVPIQNQPVDSVLLDHVYDIQTTFEAIASETEDQDQQRLFLEQANKFNMIYESVASGNLYNRKETNQLIKEANKIIKSFEDGKKIDEKKLEKIMVKMIETQDNELREGYAQLKGEHQNLIYADEEKKLILDGYDKEDDMRIEYEDMSKQATEENKQGKLALLKKALNNYFEHFGIMILNGFDKHGRILKGKFKSLPGQMDTQIHMEQILSLQNYFNNEESPNVDGVVQLFEKTYTKIPTFLSLARYFDGIKHVKHTKAAKAAKTTRKVPTTPVLRIESFASDNESDIVDDDESGFHTPDLSIIEAEESEVETPYKERTRGHKKGGGRRNTFNLIVH